MKLYNKDRDNIYFLLILIVILEIFIIYNKDISLLFGLNETSNLWSLFQTVIGLVGLFIAIKQLEYGLKQIKDGILKDGKNIKLAEYNTLKSFAYNLKIEILKKTSNVGNNYLDILQKRSSLFESSNYNITHLNEEFNRIERKGKKMAEELGETRDI